MDNGDVCVSDGDDRARRRPSLRRRTGPLHLQHRTARLHTGTQNNSLNNFIYVCDERFSKNGRERVKCPRKKASKALIFVAD